MRNPADMPWSPGPPRRSTGCVGTVAALVVVVLCVAALVWFLDTRPPTCEGTTGIIYHGGKPVAIPDHPECAR